VGKVKDAHGIRGELFIVLFAGETAWLKQLVKTEELRLVLESAGPDASAPRILILKSARPHKNGLIVKTDSLKDRNEAEALKGWLLEIPSSFMVSKPGEAMYLREILGFQVSTESQGLIGPIVKFSSNVAQDLLVVQTAKGEFEIPFVDAFVKKLDHKNKTLHMDLPYGLLGEDLEIVRDGQNDHLADDSGPDIDSKVEGGTAEKAQTPTHKV
jgi:16S rRNA processing protein RimM